MRKFGISVLFVLLLLVIGCKGQAVAPGVGVPFIGGTDGLSIEYIPDSPPPEVFDEGDFPFDVVVKVQNQGEYLVASNDAVVKVSGILPSEFSTSASALTENPGEDLLPKRKDSDGNIIPSNPVFVEFTGLNHVTPIVGAAQTFPIRAEICYAYGTLANTLLCSRENILVPEKNGICDVDAQKTVYNSGAPVQITSLRESPRAANKIGFTFKVAHVGDGKLFERGSVCVDDRTLKDRVYVEVSSGLPGLSCTGLGGGGDASGSATLFGGEKIITCTQNIPSPADFEFPIVIEVTYDYEEGVQTSIIVKSVS